MAQLKASKVDTVIMVVAVFFACLLSFSAGTFIGKRFSDYQYQIAQLKGQSASDSVAHTNETPPEPIKSEMANIQAHSDAMMSDEEVAALAAEFERAAESQSTLESTDTTTAANSSSKKDEALLADTKKPETITPATVQAPSSLDTKLGKEQDRQVASESSTPSAPAQVTKPTAALANQIKAEKTAKFTVQVGAFPNEADATAKDQELKKLGLSSFVVKAQVVDKKDLSKVSTVFRVGVGMFNASKEAEAYKAQLLTEKKITSAFVQRLDGE